MLSVVGPGKQHLCSVLLLGFFIYSPLTPSVCPYLIYHHYVPLGDSKRNSRSSNRKESACNAGDQFSIPGSGRSSGKGNGNPLQDSCLADSVDRDSMAGYSP